MSKLTGDGSDDSLDIHTKQSSLNDVSEVDYNRDRTVSELEMKLEIERLKYRVLEQEHKLQYHEMRLSGGQNPTGYGAIGRVIDYNQGSSHISSQPILSKNTREEESVDHARAEQISVAELVDTEQQQLVDTGDPNSFEVDSAETNISSESISSENISSENISSENISSESISSESISSESIATSVDESAGQVVLTNSNEMEAESNQTASEVEIDDHQENLTKVEPVLLPSLFDPPLKPPVGIS